MSVVTDEMRAQYKKENPYNFQYLWGGFPDDEYILKYFDTTGRVRDFVHGTLDNTEKVYNAGKGIAGGGVEFIGNAFGSGSWVRQNWQIAIIGVVAIIVLLRD